MRVGYISSKFQKEIMVYGLATMVGNDEISLSKRYKNWYHRANTLRDYSSIYATLDIYIKSDVFLIEKFNSNINMTNDEIIKVKQKIMRSRLKNKNIFYKPSLTCLVDLLDYMPTPLIEKEVKKKLNSYSVTDRQLAINNIKKRKNQKRYLLHKKSFLVKRIQKKDRVK